MKTLVIDTSATYLVIGYAEDKKIMTYIQEVIPKQQSEFLIPRVQEILSQHGIVPQDLERIVVTDGPGSYTGLRIGLTFVKTLALVYPKLKVYTVDTLAAIAGLETGFSLLDARSNRVYGAYINNGLVTEERIYTLDEVKEIKDELWGDLHLLQQEDRYGNMAQNILDLHEHWHAVKNVDVLVPRYLK